MLLIDSDVIIWYMKGNPKVYNVIEEQKVFFISVVSYMELIQGMQNKRELILVRKTIRNWNAKILYINEDISFKAMFFVELL